VRDRLRVLDGHEGGVVRRDAQIEEVLVEIGAADLVVHQVHGLKAAQHVQVVVAQLGEVFGDVTGLLGKSSIGGFLDAVTGTPPSYATEQQADGKHGPGTAVQPLRFFFGLANVDQHPGSLTWRCPPARRSALSVYRTGAVGLDPQIRGWCPKTVPGWHRT